MSSDVDAQIERARAAMERISSDYRGHSKRLRRTADTIGKKLTRIAIADAVILFAAVIVGLFIPLGIFGALAVMMLMVAATLMIAMAPVHRAPTEEKLARVDIRALPGQTERWLEARRAALPAPARTLVDQIGVRLDALSPQLGALDDGHEAAYEVRRLIGEQLPAFVKDYERVPQPLRAQPRNGKTPDAELIDGLRLIEQEIGEMTARLAQTDLDSLATRGRYLEMKYRGDEPVR
jgi:hypothetical protein